MLGRAPSLNIFRHDGQRGHGVRPVAALGSGAALGPRSLTRCLRELAILRVAHLTPHAEYEWIQHVGIAKAVGATDDQIAALDSGDIGAACFSDLEQMVLRFTTEVVHDARASEETLAELEPATCLLAR